MPEAIFHTQQRIGSEFNAVRKAAAAVETEVHTLGRAVHQLEKQTLLYGDLEHYLRVIEREIEDVCSALQRIAEAQAAAAQPVSANSGGSLSGGSGSSPAPARHGSRLGSGGSTPRRV